VYAFLPFSVFRGERLNIQCVRLQPRFTEIRKKQQAEDAAATCLRLSYSFSFYGYNREMINAAANV
jgi:hypothetical protein